LLHVEFISAFRADDNLPQEFVAFLLPPIQALGWLYGVRALVKPPFPGGTFALDVWPWAFH
jgi:hypothetical protein